MAAEQVYKVADVKIGGPLFPSAGPTNISTTFFLSFCHCPLKSADSK